MIGAAGTSVVGIELDGSGAASLSSTGVASTAGAGSVTIAGWRAAVAGSRATAAGSRAPIDGSGATTLEGGSALPLRSVLVKLPQPVNNRPAMMPTTMVPHTRPVPDSELRTSGPPEHAGSSPYIGRI